MQVSLLRFLDRKEYRPVGSTRTLQADVRIVGATNGDLQELVHQGRFRDDLLYRINTVTLRVPSLRERPEDIPRLAEYFLATIRIPGTAVRSFAPDAIARLVAYAWPGNIRELRNVIERVALMNPSATSRPVSLEDIAQVLPQPAAGHDAADQTNLSMDDMERIHILRVLDAHRGNKTHAAKALQIDYKTLLTKLKKYGLSP